MEAAILSKYKKAGEIAAQVGALALKKARPGMSILELATALEAEIVRLGAKPAFPVNISINDIAAHYTPSASDKAEIRPGDLVKVDVGTHIDGYIGDMAVTYCSEKSSLVEAAEKVLAAGVKAVRPGATVGEIGGVIEDAAASLGVGVIVNLTGHGLDEYIFHGMPTIPNVRTKDATMLEEGSVIALEPFIAESNGHVKESGITEIYRHLMDRPVRLPEARLILSMARDQWNSLPFAKRWLAQSLTPVKISMAIRQLEQAMALESYPTLREASGRPIAQAEHTIIVKEKPIVTTLQVE